MSHESTALELSHTEASLHRARDHLRDEEHALADAVKALEDFSIEARQMIKQQRAEQRTRRQAEREKVS